MALSETEYVALAAEAVRRASGVELDGTRITIGLAMIHEAEGRRSRRARKSVATLRTLLGDESDLSLTAAVPTFRFALAGHRVHVLCRDDHTAAATHQRYQRIAEELHLGTDIGLLGHQSPADRQENDTRQVVIGGITRFAIRHASVTWRKAEHVGVLRAPEVRSTYARRYTRLTTL